MSRDAGASDVVVDSRAGGRVQEESADGDFVTGRSLAVGGYRAGLDGLRAMCMIAVFAYHGGLPFSKGTYLGISAFFTLSGFLITGVLLRSREGGRGLDVRQFWIRRFRRLMPAAIVCLIGIVVFGATIATRQQAEELPGHVAAAATYSANWYFVLTHKSYVDLFSSPSPVQHFWSLAVEEQFYLLMPVALLLFFRLSQSLRKLAWIFGAGVVASTGWMIYLYRAGAGLDRLYYGTDTRMAEILMGALLAVALYERGPISRRARSAMGIVGSLAFVAAAWAMTSVALTDGPLWQGGFLLFAGITCLVILALVTEGGPLSALLSWGPLPGIGRLTYGLYLYHWPIFLWLDAERTGLSLWPLFALRVGVTLAAASVSQRFIEMPIRKGATLGLPLSARILAGPVALVLVVSGAAVTANRSAPDPLETIRSNGRPLAGPVVPTDGVLDVLVITDAAGDEVGDRLQQIGREDKTIRVSRSQFECGTVDKDSKKPICSNWESSWPGLVRQEDPDIVLLYLDDWPASELQRLSGGLGPAKQPGFAASVLGNGFDILTSRGAPILWASSGTGLAGGLARVNLPLTLAMDQLESQRTDLRRVLGGRLPDQATTPHPKFIDLTARTLLADASLYQRQPSERLPKIMVIGDSQARSLGYGLERWAAEGDRAIVWNIASEGCGLAPDGSFRGFGGRPTPVSQRCRETVESLPTQIGSFRPDLVIVLSSIWDVQDRSAPSWKGFRSVGDPAVDEYLRQAYEHVVDVLSAKGASIVWMKSPCNRFEPVPGQSTAVPDAFDPVRTKVLNSEVVEPLVRERREDVSLFDLNAAVCPGGKYVNTLDGVEGIRSDGIHFSVDGALWFADKYGQEILDMAPKR